ncbi:Ger(x)C family spore germination protein [Paenibacillus sp. KN14-4R]|uniref:Ger(x)C family spore germination protein n=1 Tax=Paenibacillus sp. KN14-4R TaxID=3445773 RepID=UPI003F9F391C
MRKALFILVIICLTCFVTGCKDQNIIENLTLSLVIGIDLNENNELVFSLSSPVFNKEAKDKEEQYEVKTTSLRKSREKFDMHVLGITNGGKAQVILIGKRLAQQPEWYTLLDGFFRDAKNTVTSRLVLVDGSVTDIMHLAPKDKPRLPIYLTKMIDTSILRNETIKTTLQEFHRQTLDKGVTASITEIGLKEKRIEIIGAALLDEQSHYKLAIQSGDTKLLYMLQHKLKGKFPFTLELPDIPSKGELIQKNELSFDTQTISVKTDARYENDKFRFDVNIKMGISLTELYFPLDLRKSGSKLEAQIEEELDRHFKRFVQKIQKAHIDPVGFGTYARAYANPEWLKVQDHWGDAFARAEVHVKTNVKILGMGIVK